MSEQSILFVGGIMIGLMAGVLLMLVVGSPMRKEAVECGCVEWVVSSSGNAKWQWKEAK